MGFSIHAISIDYRRTSLKSARSLGELLQFGFGKFQTFPFHVLVRCVGQQLVESDDISWNLKLNKSMKYFAKAQF